MENKEHFGALTERMQAFREETLNQKPHIDAERALLVTETYKANQNQPPVMKRALALKNVLENMTIYIEDKTLIVGNQATKNCNAPIFPEYTMGFVIDELDKFEKRDGDVFYITEETKQQLRDIAPFWKNNCLHDRGMALLPEEVLDVLPSLGMEGKLNAGDAHLAVNYQKVITDGLLGYENRVRELKNNLDLTQLDSIDKNIFYKAVLIVLDSVRNFALRYSKLATELAAKESDSKRKAELEEIARVCEKVPYYPADSFREAVQAVWFIHVILQIESNGHSLSYGRFDQYMYPLYQKDIDAGKITRDAALELLTCLWIKTLTVQKIRSQAHTLSSAGSPMYQNVTVGGQTTDKKDAVNDLSFLVLQSIAQTRLTQPNFTVRYHANIDKKFMEECIEVMKLGFGMPALNNDEIIIPSFINWGVKEEDAYNYSAIGCVETAVPGKWGYRCTGMSYINFPRVLLCAMNNGVDMTSGKRFTKGYGYFKDWTSYEQLMDVWDKTVREMTKYSAIVENAIDRASERDVPDILCSALTDDCIARGKTIKEGGAVYDFISGLQVGIADMADSLAAIKKLVFEKKKITPAQLWDAILDNFTSPESQRIQDMLINDAPKYGNDIDYVDELIVEAYDSYLDEIKKYPNTRYLRGPVGGIRYGGTSSISANVGQGMGTMATPNGRKAKEPLAEGCSPAHNADKNGPTAVFKSVAKLRTEKITGGVLLNQKMTPQILAKEENKQKLIMLIRTFFNRLHGYHVQYNIVSRETLIDAQLHPEKHKDLIVRVAGYSAFFNALSKATQDDIIDRTEQTL
ncbi:MAG: glycyl radical protein [Selenomonadaceae bacterium]|nr:glycyl radical protein [Selenomonadaceae bacterium]